MRCGFRNWIVRWLLFWGMPVIAGGLSAEILPLESQPEGLAAGDSLVLKRDGTWKAQRTEAGGVILRWSTERAWSERMFEVGKMPALTRLMALYRKRSSCWIEPAFGGTIGQVPPETQFLLAELQGGALHAVLLPLIDPKVRCSLVGDRVDAVHLLAESGDPQVTATSAEGLYLLVGDDPYELVSRAAVEVRRLLGTAEPRPEREVPDFVRYYGWCSWNAFYDRISEANLRKAMEAYAQGGVQPGFVVVDNGWQQISDDKMLTGYGAIRQKFPGGVAGTVRMLKGEFGISRVLLWQTFNGYWRGADSNRLPAVGVRPMEAMIPSRYREQRRPMQRDGPIDTMGKSFYPDFFYDEVVGQPDLIDFYSDYHGHLAAAGVDGVKIDAITWIELLGEGAGGRVGAMADLVTAAEASGRDYFDRNIIWCSSCSSDMILQAPRWAVTRSSQDFLPKVPASHGRHLVINAQASLWMGEFVIPDWDMFQSGHESGPFHAAARAISGGPVYSTDEVGQEDFDVLSKLVMFDRTVPLTQTHARPSPASLYEDPAVSGRPLKIFNRNTTGYVVGAFNCSFGEGENHDAVGTLGPKDVPGISGERFALYLQEAADLRTLGRTESVPVMLSPLGFEIATLVPIRDGFAPIGIADLFNSGGAIEHFEQVGRSVHLSLHDGGRFLAYSVSRPSAVVANDQAVPHDYDPRSGCLTVDLAAGSPTTLRIEL